MEPSGKTIADATTALSARTAVAKLLEASRSGNLDEFKGAAKSFGAGILEVKDANGRGPLHFAARGGNLDVCRYLVEDLQFPVDQRDNDGETALLHAARVGDFKTAKFLVESGADVSAASSDLRTTPLHHAAGNNSLDLIRLFLEKGASINSQSDSGTPLVWAAGHGNLEAVKLLLQNKADPNDYAETGATALLSAAAAGSCEVVRTLLEHGAPVNVAAGGVTPLHIAADSGDEKMVKLLLEAGADPNARDEEGATPIQAAAARNHKAIVELLFPLTSPCVSGEWSVEKLIAGQQQTALTAQVSQEMLEKAEEAKLRGSEAFKRKDYAQAIDAYTQALDIDPMNASVYSNRSLCWIRTGQPEHALKDAKTAVALKPDWAKARYREGVALRLLKKFDEAAVAFYEGVKLEPSNKELNDAFREAVESGKEHHLTTKEVRAEDSSV